MNRLNEITATEVVKKIKIGQVTAEAVMRDCLDRIAEREATIKAWAYLNREQALEAAVEIDRGEKSTPLAGLPVGIKDVLDTSDMPTEMGSPIYNEWQPKVDAACVGVMRAAGAIIMGKTVTCEFAGSFPGFSQQPASGTRRRRTAPNGERSGGAADDGGDADDGVESQTEKPSGKQPTSCASCYYKYELTDEGTCQKVKEVFHS